MSALAYIYLGSAGGFTGLTIWGIVSERDRFLSLVVGCAVAAVLLWIVFVSVA